MSAQSTPPRNNANELAKGGIVSRRDVLKGALVGAGALAALALPTPLLDIVPGSAPKKALASNQSISGGIYAIRWFSDNSWSLDLPDSNPNPVNVEVFTSHNAPNQYWVVAYDSDCDGYRISPVCGHTPGMVLTATAGSGNDVRTAKDQALSTQRWTFKQNTNGSWSILSMADPTLCVNLWTGHPSDCGSIKLFDHATGSAGGWWTLDCLAPSVKTNLHYVEDISQIYPSQTKISNARENHAKILSMPSGWSVEYSDAGNPIRFTAADQLTSPAKFTFLYEDCLDINDKAADVQIDLTVLSQSMHAANRVTFDLGYEDGGRLTGSLFDGITVRRSDKWDVKYTAYDHETGGQISLKGAWLTAFSISGVEYGDPCNFRAYRDSGGAYGNNYEGVAYLQAEGSIDAYIYKSHKLCNFCEGVYFGKDLTLQESDYPGAPGSESNAAAFICADDSPTFRFFCFSFFDRGKSLSAWFYPMFCPLGITEPDAPTKSAKITS